MKKEEILTITHDKRIRKDNGVVGDLLSLHNLIRKNVIYKSFYFEKTSHSHVFAEPVYKIIEDKTNIFNMMEKIDFNMLQQMHEKCNDYCDYYKFITTTGTTITIPAKKLSDEVKNNLDNLIENNTYVGTTSERYVDYPPLLNYRYSTIDQKLNLLDEIVPYIQQKQKSAFYSILSKNCIYNSENKKLIGKKEIKKHINSITGLFNFKIPFEVGTSYCGYINDNMQSDILIEISYCLRTIKNRINKYVAFEFGNDQIKCIRVFSDKEIVVKRLNDTAMKYVKNKKYNDYDEQLITEIKKYNKTYYEMLNELFPPTGTRTYMKDIRN